MVKKKWLEDYNPGTLAAHVAETNKERDATVILDPYALSVGSTLELWADWFSIPQWIPGRVAQKRDSDMRFFMAARGWRHPFFPRLKCYMVGLRVGMRVRGLSTVPTAATLPNARQRERELRALLTEARILLRPQPPRVARFEYRRTALLEQIDRVLASTVEAEAGAPTQGKERYEHDL